MSSLGFRILQLGVQGCGCGAYLDTHPADGPALNHSGQSTLGQRVPPVSETSQPCSIPGERALEEGPYGPS